MDAPNTTLILGELLYTGEANQKAGVKKGTADSEAGAEGKEDQLVRKEMDATADRLRLSEDRQEEEEGIKVILNQQPKDDDALRQFLTILTTVLNTLSSEKD